MSSDIKLFESKEVKTVWDAVQEKWYVSVIYDIEVLIRTNRPRKYWNDLKSKLKKKEVYCPKKSDG
jgi:hypothetical protein